MEHIGKQIILMGGVAILVGILIYFFGNSLSWFGNTPLDFSYKTDKVKIYFPIGSMIFISIIISFIVRIFNQ